MRSRLWLAIAMTLLVSACQDRKPEPLFLSSADGRTVGEATENQHFIEFRARYALSYGHSYVLYGRLDAAGNPVNFEVAGLHPKSDSEVPYVVGHFLPVAAETGSSDGDLEEQYRSASWRVLLTEAEYRKVAADVQELKDSSPVWHASLYNCNAFVGDIAKSMGYKTPPIWLRPQQFITPLRKMATDS